MMNCGSRVGPKKRKPRYLPGRKSVSAAAVDMSIVKTVRRKGYERRTNSTRNRSLDEASKGRCVVIGQDLQPEGGRMTPTQQLVLVRQLQKMYPDHAVGIKVGVDSILG
jgi:hypothetical protein